jgi:CHAT domain-containing protein/tetratricopeptide (TPR) repeat protein
MVGFPERALKSTAKFLTQPYRARSLTPQGVEPLPKPLVVSALGFFFLMGLAVPSAFAQTSPRPLKEGTQASQKVLAPSLLSESCVLKPREDMAPAPGLPVDQMLYCEQRLAGSFVVSRAPQGLEIFKAYQQSRAASQNNQRMSCGGQALAIPELGPHTAGLPCRLANGGWPHLVLLHESNGQLMALEASPGLLPTMASALGTNGPSLTKSQATDILQRVFGGPVPLASASDLSGFNDALKDARAANAQGRYRDAESLYRTLLDLQTKVLKPTDTAIAETLMDLALNVSNQGRDEEALALFRRAEPILQASANRADRARFSSYQGYHAANAARYDQALQFASAAVAEWRAIAQGPNLNFASLTGGNDEQDPRAFDKGELALALNLQANMALRMEELGLAQAAASEALQTLKDTRGLPRWWKADILLTLGKITSAQGRLSAAEQYLNTALEEKKLAAGDGLPTLRIRIALAQAYQREGMNSSAIITYREIFKQVRSLPPGSDGVLNKEDLIAFGLAVSDYAQTLKDSQQIQGLYNETFEAFQLIRPTAVAQTLQKASQQRAVSNPKLAARMAELIAAERARDAANLELSYETSLPDDQRSRIVEDKLAATKARAEKDLARLQKLLRDEFPDYAEITTPKRLTPVGFRERLGANEAVVSFLLGEKVSFVQLIRRDSMRMAKIPEGQASIAETVTTLRRALEIQAGSVNEFDAVLAHQLFTRLLGPVQDGLQGVNHLVVIPAGPLASLPFALLVEQAPVATGNYHQTAWLVNRMAISHLPSLNAFFVQRAQKPPASAKQSLLAFGNPSLKGASLLSLPRVVASRSSGQSRAAQLGASAKELEGEATAMSALATSCRQAGPAPAEMLSALAPLPETETELKSIARVFGKQGARVFLAEQATEPQLRSQALDDYKVIYFATHGLLPGELKCQAEPGLVLTPPAQTPALSNPQAREEDGLLEASEIASLRFNADLVVLSACNTAGGSGRFGGDALSGLAESFFHAGARRLLVSHWQVPSKATARLMTRLFETMGPDMAVGPSRSLQAAQLSLIRQPQSAHPFFWAAFVLVGDGLDDAWLPLPRGPKL